MVEKNAQVDEVTSNVPADKYFNPGSSIRLQCIIRRNLLKNISIQDLTNIAWFNGNRTLDVESDPRLRLVSQDVYESWNYLYYRTSVEVTGSQVRSRLIISRARIGDAGTYYCSLPVIQSIAVQGIRVHLLVGKIKIFSLSNFTSKFLF